MFDFFLNFIADNVNDSKSVIASTGKVEMHFWFVKARYATLITLSDDTMTAMQQVIEKRHGYGGGQCHTQLCLCIALLHRPIEE